MLKFSTLKIAGIHSVRFPTLSLKKALGPKKCSLRTLLRNMQCVRITLIVYVMHSILQILQSYFYERA